jgi:hypothetical protein
VFPFETIHFLTVTGHDRRIHLESGSGDDRGRTSCSDTSVTSEEGTNCEGAPSSKEGISSEENDKGEGNDVNVLVRCVVD